MPKVSIITIVQIIFTHATKNIDNKTPKATYIKESSVRYGIFDMDYIFLGNS